MLMLALVAMVVVVLVVVVVVNAAERGVVSPGSWPAAVVRSPPTPTPTPATIAAAGAAKPTAVGTEATAPPPGGAEVVVVVHGELVAEEGGHAVVRNVAEPSVARLGERLAEHVQVVLLRIPRYSFFFNCR